MGIKRFHINVTGHVQGVGYRASTKQQADALAISGWVCNHTDGRVEIMAQGEKTSVLELIEWCKHGPEHAEVAHVESIETEASSEFNDFQIR
jgi:acylphosphatase